jgi:hypothetical protein
MVILHRIWLVLGWIICLAEGTMYQNDTQLLEAPQRMPGNDEWYRAPRGFENEAPGTILKYRKSPRGLAINNKDQLKIRDSWQILYRTRNIHNIAEASVVTVSIPNGFNRKKIFMYHWFAVSYEII